MYGINAWFLATLVMGALWWVAIAARPAWSALPADAASRAYTKEFSRGGPVLALLALAAAGLAVAQGLVDGDVTWLLGAAMLIAAILWTVMLMAKPGHRLRDGDPEAHRILERWAALHWVRTALVTSAVIHFIVAAH